MSQNFLTGYIGRRKINESDWLGLERVMEERFSNVYVEEKLSRKANLAIMLATCLLSFYVMSHWIGRPISPDERKYLAWAMKLYREGFYADIDGRPIVEVPPLYVYSLAFFQTIWP